MLALCFSPAPLQAGAAPNGPVGVLDTAGVWRMHHTLKPPIIQQANGGLEPLMFGVQWLDWETPEPPADWTKPEMNDRTWMRGPARRSARTPYLSQLSLRGKFEVTNPAAVGDLAVAVEYYGGVIVYLNGTEVGRGNLPAGELTAAAPAEPYPLNAFINPGGKLYGDRRVPEPKPDMRVRQLGVPVPKRLLRKGLNVLAVEVLRAPYPEALLDKHGYGVGGTTKDPGIHWNTCEIRAVRLTASRPGGIVPNTTRPEGLQIWNADTLAFDVDVDYGDRTEPLLPVTIVSPRNGSAWGKVVIGSDKPIQNLKAVAGDLKSDAAAIPASAVAVRYGVPGGNIRLEPNDRISPYPDRFGFLNNMVDEPPAEVAVAARSHNPERVNGAVIPLWIRVQVPADCPPGSYEGTVTVTAADSAPRPVPMAVTVLPWTSPSPQDFRTWVDLAQSPDTLAVEYDVPLWSDRHFNLIARSFDLISDTGARSLYVPAIAHTNMGNEESMIRWIKKPDGSYDWDFSVMDRYLDAARDHLGTPKLIVLQVWEVYMNTKDSTGRRFGLVLEQNQKNTGGAPLVTFVDAHGRTENGTIPKLADPKSREIWRALLTKVKDRLKARGLEKTLALGMFTDSIPNKADTQMFLDIAPDLGWVQQGHNAFTRLHGIVDVTYTATWWSARFADDLVNRRSGAIGRTTYRDHETHMTSLRGWNKPRLDAYFPRMTNERHPVSFWRFLCETAITADFYRGIGRVGADYWPAIKKNGRRAGWVNDRHIEVAGYLHELRSYLLEPGDEQPVATNRLVALEEGVRECEALIVIEDALVNKDLARRDAELAKRCQEVLEERLLHMWKGLDEMQFGGWGITAWRFQPGISGHAWLLNTAHQERTKKLYTLAYEVEQQLGR